MQTTPVKLVYNPPDGQNPFVANWVHDDGHRFNFITAKTYSITPMVIMDQNPGNSSEMSDYWWWNITTPTYKNSDCMRVWYPYDFISQIHNSNLDWNYCYPGISSGSSDIEQSAGVLAIKSGEMVNITVQDYNYVVTDTGAGTREKLPFSTATVTAYVRNTGWLITSTIFP
jgi:hypothetical protein